MTDTASRSRRPAGAPASTGGQYAPETRAAVDISLDPGRPARPALEKHGNGEWLIDSPSVTERSSDGRTRIEIRIGGNPERSVVNHAIVATWPPGRPTLSERLDAAWASGSAPVTLLYIGSGGTIGALECRTYTDRNRAKYLIKKGSSTRGYSLCNVDVVDLANGFNGQEKFADAWHDRKAQFPLAVEKFSTDDIPEDDGTERDGSIAAVYLIDHPGFGSDGECATRGCLYFATDQDSGNGIVNGYLWVPNGSGLTAEHGSMYAKDLARWGGRVANADTSRITFGQLVREECPTDRTQAYRWVAGLD